MVRFDEVTEFMNQMMKVQVLPSSGKRKILEDDSKTLLDPNLIMDTRHRIFRENLSDSPAKCSVLAEARRLMTHEQTKELHLKREQENLEKELRKFEKELNRSRPKFHGPYTCSKRNLVSSDNEDFWRTSSRVRVKAARNRARKNSGQQNAGFIQVTSKGINTKDSENELIAADDEVPCFGSIKVTIRGKSDYGRDERRLCALRSCFAALRQNAKEERRLRDIKVKIQEIEALRKMRKYFDIWRAYVEKARKVAQARIIEREVSDEQKIEMFINAITEKQKELMKCRRSKSDHVSGAFSSPDNREIQKKDVHGKRAIVESPAESRLKAQKRIIEKQRVQLEKQNKIIEELKLKQMQEEICKAGKETMSVAKDTLTHCGRKTKRTLIQLMRQAGYRDKSLTVSLRAPSPPKFLIQMEIRAEARKQRIKVAEEERRKKLEEQKRQEEQARLEEEMDRKRLQQEALREARRIREEQEQYRLREIERFRKLNNKANEFYRRYLLRHYLLEPFLALVEMRNGHIKKAEDYHRKNLMKKILVVWRTETEKKIDAKIERAVSLYNKNVLCRAFRTWNQISKEGSMNFQVAKDFYDMKVLDKCFKTWQIRTFERKMRYQEKEKIAQKHYLMRLQSNSLKKWQRYPQIAAEMKESEIRKRELRQIVQKLIPDFEPNYEDAMIEI
ncbi:hypothetical protein KM043_002702 [Ampulex compressa]|nr:hypothetical protein KM043_002702 [Ampulex compressa]